MNCKSVQNRLSAYLDRELGGDELLQIRAHVSVCRECRMEAEGLRSLKSLLGGVQCPEPPADLAEKLTANMMRQRYEVPRKTVRVSALMFAGVAACSMFATLAVLNLNVVRSRNPSVLHLSGGSALDVPNAEGFGKPSFDDGPVISAANFGLR